MFIQMKTFPVTISTARSCPARFSAHEKSTCILLGTFDDDDDDDDNDDENASKPSLFGVATT